MKRALQILGGNASARSAPPVFVRVGSRIVSVSDAGDGSAARTFVASLTAAGAEPIDREIEPRPDDRLVIRTTPASPEAQLRAEALEEAADVVLGSVRPTFAVLFAAACARGANS
ncbi:MAG: hypothetical protein AMJ62_08640 [Myxococcales bacterium SG8_38]|nr:MAG: hypothetical protein AMJ62_08640 [Myxococcales bacterium SG8_38]